MLRFEELELGLGDFRLRADFSLRAGVCASVIGPSGAGKSTFLAAIAGFVAPLSGRILWQGEDLAPRSPGNRPVSMVFQDNNLFPHLTVGQNVGLGRNPRLRLHAEDVSAVVAVLDRVGLGGMQDRKPAQLSGGQQSRAALARVLLQKRPILLLDEPFSALGPALRQEMQAFVAEVARENGLTVLLVTHEPANAAMFSDSCIVIGKGTAIGPCSTAGVLADPPESLSGYLPN